MKTNQDLTANEFEKLYQLNRNHIADMLFFDDEERFLNDLLNKNFMEQLKQEHLNKIKFIHNNLTQLHLVKKNVVKDILTHKGNLEMKFRDIFTHDIYFFELESERVSQEISDLNKSFKKIKKEIFGLFKKIINPH